jgi:ribose 5-phosphate isomerase A
MTQCVGWIDARPTTLGLGMSENKSRYIMSKASAPDPSAVNRFKEAAAQAAVEQLEDGMVVGLGSGTTATLAVSAIGRRVQEGLRIIGIPTSEQTAGFARSLGIVLSTLAEHARLDLTIDGADEVESGTLDLIKGGGGNLLREKIVAASSARLVIIADERKVVQRLGSRAMVPVEVVPFGWQATANRLSRSGTDPVLRLGAGGESFLTDGRHYIVDCSYGPIADPLALQAQLDCTIGVVEHGLFLGLATEAFIGGTDGVSRLRRG